MRRSSIVCRNLSWLLAAASASVFAFASSNSWSASGDLVDGVGVRSWSASRVGVSGIEVHDQAR